ncbi:MAG: hypothetical protein EU548_02945 [Promethearchaeota archaeon]|nr:MAG: hypothetical protein EU548_02945 [Candidatus Lokiarchaeota archaeon]
MNKFFSILLNKPWDKLKTQKLTEVKLLSLKSVFESYPIIQREFFDDLISNVYNHSHFTYIESIRRVVGSESEDYEIAPWLFLWAFDDQRRMYQFLFQKTKTNKESSPAALVALAPPELAKLFSQFKDQAIHKIFSLLNTPSNIKFLIMLGPKGKSIAEESKFLQIDKQKLQNLQTFKKMANMPNIQGQWFPNYAPRCPMCNAVLVGIEDYKVGFGKLICPRCGYKQ